MANQGPSDVEKLAELLPDFEQFFGNLTEEAVQEQLKSRLAAIEQEAVEMQAALVAKITDAQELVTTAEAEVALGQAEEQAQASVTAAKGEELAEAQVEFVSAKTEHESAEKLGLDERLEGERLREEKEKHTALLTGPLRILTEGSGTSVQATENRVKQIQEHLQAIGAEKALIAAVPGALRQPNHRGALRGDFDNQTIEIINEVLSQHLARLEEKLLERAPSEKEASTEMLGLWALMDVTQDKEQVATEAHAAEEVLLKAAKAKSRILRKEATRLQKAADAFRAELQLESEKAKDAANGVATLERLCAEGQAKRAADEEVAAAPSPKRARIEADDSMQGEEQEQLTAAVEETPEEAVTESEPMTKDLVATKPVQVASPARARPTALVA